jgi:hypothetical protein
LRSAHPSPASIPGSIRLLNIFRPLWIDPPPPSIRSPLPDDPSNPAPLPIPHQILDIAHAHLQLLRNLSLKH